MTMTPSPESWPMIKTKNLVESMKCYGVELEGKTNKSVLTLTRIVEKEKLCLFCLGEEGDPDEFGEFIHHKSSGIRIHHFCLLLASNLEQRCEESHCDLMETAKTIYGFLVEDIFYEFKRGSKLVCSICCKHGATIGCSVPQCRSKLHFKCGLQRHYLFQYFGSFQSYCKKHRPTQCQVLSSTDSTTCNICFEDIIPKSDFDALSPPCCKTTWFHRKCIKKQALSSGLYFFRCPMCNNKDEFTDEMLRMGIYIPNRDASWETPDAFSDLFEHTILCDISRCKCTHGRKYDCTGTIWSISICVLCGSSGAHIACAMLKTLTSPYVCEICCSIHGRAAIRKTLHDMGFDGLVRSTCSDSVNNLESAAKTESGENNENQCFTIREKRKRESQDAAESFSGTSRSQEVTSCNPGYDQVDHTVYKVTGPEQIVGDEAPFAQGMLTFCHHTPQCLDFQSGGESQQDAT